MERKNDSYPAGQDDLHGGAGVAQPARARRGTRKDEGGGLRGAEPRPHRGKKGGSWWGNSVIQVCQKPYQFSCWNKSDANYRRVLAADENDAHFALAEGVAALALAGKLEDATGGATHYHAAGAMLEWAAREIPVAVIGRHVFYRMEI